MVVMNLRRQDGFTLLEAVIALTILAAGATALYGWVNTNLLALNRVYAINASVGSVRNILEELRASDPVSESELRFEYGGAIINVQREPSDYTAPAIGDDGRLSVNNATLYQTTITITPQKRPPTNFQLWELGLSQVRSVDEVLF